MSSENLELDAANVSELSGVGASDMTGATAAHAGDVNGDGFDDLIVGAPGAAGRGAAYVVFGRADGIPDLALSSLNGANGFRILGEAAGDNFGFAVSGVGDVNDDGVDDLLVGAFLADDDGDADAGRSYVIFGDTGGFAATVQAANLDGDDGFRIDGVNSDDRSGFAVSGVGDFNGDGVDDFLVSAPRADAGGDNRGETHLIFGDDGGFAATFDLQNINGANGVTFNGAVDLDLSGADVANAGDLNNDGRDDIIIGAEFSDDGGVNAGKVHIVFGTGATGADFSLAGLNGANGFTFASGDANDLTGSDVAGGGDANGDGIDDIVIGARFANGGRGEVYVVFGKNGGFSANLSPDNLNGSNGFTLKGVDIGDETGFSVDIGGDFNGDGIDDILIGARGADQTAGGNEGEAYVIFGKSSGFDAVIELADITDDDGLRLLGDDAGDRAGSAVSFVGDLNNDGFDDVLIGAPDGADADEAYIVYGTNHVLQGGNGGDRLEGFNGDDTITGGNGKDRLLGGDHDDQIFGGNGKDTVVGQADDDRVFGGNGNDVVKGNGGDDFLSGGRGKDRLVGGAGDDKLKGDKGADKIKGGAGNDTLIGGGGPDTFFFRRDGGFDKVNGFKQGADKLKIQGVKSLAQLEFSERGANTLIEYDGGRILVKKSNPDDFSAADFLGFGRVDPVLKPEDELEVLFRMSAEDLL